MKQATIRQRKGSFDSQLNCSLFQSNFITGEQKKQIGDEIINDQIDDEFEMIEKYKIVYQIRTKKSDDQKLYLAATLIQQRGIPYLKKAIWMTFIEKGDAKQYFDKKPPQIIEDQIQKDVPRTGYEDKMNNKKYTNLLYRILCPYAIYNPKIGYTQGMNIICGKIILLLSIDGNDKQVELDNVEVIENEKEMFWMFVHLMKSMEDLFIQGVPGIHKRIFQLEQMIENRCNEILVHLQCNNIENLCFCFSQYYFTMLMQKQEKKFTRLILEMFLLYGEAFIQNFIVGILEFYSIKITRMNELERLMPFFRDTMFTSYYQELKKQKKQNQIIQHFLQNHYFEKEPYFVRPQFIPIVQIIEKKEEKLNPKNILNLLHKNIFGKILGQ
ncbi:unnamed protein product [Paramecium sonneborni]|uniref:Rab-GAP TBC domain-containing protein n=1 Tax=Paramecium sonneborni TaxID=65129 RepID=A0A8S1RSG9_9CILI|nr:unnamed protein product [Paramecium sonneborni]